MLARRLALALLIALGGQSEAFADADKREQLKNLKNRITAVQRELNSQREKRSSEQKALRTIETKLGELQRQLRNTQRDLDRQKQKLDELDTRKRSLNRQREQQEQLIEQQILAAYQLGQEKKLKMLLNQESPDTLSRALVYYDYFNKARAEEIESYRSTLKEISALEPAIQRETEALENSRAQLAAQRNALADKQRERAATVAALDAQISSRDQKLHAMRAEQDDLLKLLQAIEEEVTNISLPESYNPFHTRRGKMAWPTAGKQLHRFGSSRDGSSMNWNGVVIASAKGSPVKAIHHGRVVFSDWLRGAGLLIIVDHGGGYMSLYGHNESLLFDTGDWVKAGDTIATVGNSGGRSETALYFEIRKNGRPTNPSAWCRG
ncbi:murein hydrolase activator EnvC [Litorivivens sp.]|uniref:murein hydrolase activator EnvC family protein n=1 Tax=Litorivivens sp. TaxID=2020868 RepID=UPI0035657802